MDDNDGPLHFLFLKRKGGLQTSFVKVECHNFSNISR